MKLELKRLHADSIASAIKRAEHYRLLNEPLQAESICLDVLAADPASQPAVATLLLALTDQFPRTLQPAFDRAMELLTRLTDLYERTYFEGLICERRAKAHLRSGSPMAGGMAHAWIERALRLFESAETMRPAGDDDAVLRWNSCARLLRTHPEIKPVPVDEREPMLE